MFVPRRPHGQTVAHVQCQRIPFAAFHGSAAQGALPIMNDDSRLGLLLIDGSSIIHFAHLEQSSYTKIAHRCMRGDDDPTIALVGLHLGASMTIV